MRTSTQTKRRAAGCANFQGTRFFSQTACRWGAPFRCPCVWKPMEPWQVDHIRRNAWEPIATRWQGTEPASRGMAPRGPPPWQWSSGLATTLPTNWGTRHQLLTQSEHWWHTEPILAFGDDMEKWATFWSWFPCGCRVAWRQGYLNRVSSKFNIIIFIC